MLLGNVARQKHFVVKHSAALVAEVAVLCVHVHSQVLLAVRHVSTLVAPECVILQLVLFTLHLGCKCFGTLVTLCPTLVTLKQRIGLEAFMAFLALENWGGWFLHWFRLDGSWGFHNSRRSRGNKAIWLVARVWKWTSSAARQQVLACYVRIKLSPAVKRVVTLKIVTNMYKSHLGKMILHLEQTICCTGCC